MTSKVLSEILTKYSNAEREGDLLHLGRAVDVSLYVVLGYETLTIDRVTTVEFSHEVLIATTSRAERFIFAYEDVRGVRYGKADAGAGY